ncbi:hypothetical protein [Flavisphingomonas formosensis]|uniref:hypothetical protein n=1 Tax=Flavisphingomonas formosensis TaxID=861534 RepID=UPI0012FBBF80|nr:hypothetical protein [Sphingomonas formosensis]
MDHDFESRSWADNRAHFTSFVTAFVRQIGVAFDVLNARLYDAPWDRRPRPLNRRDAR